MPLGSGIKGKISLSGSLDYLSISGQVITLNPINLATDVETVLPVANGGTGASTASNARTELGLKIGVDILAFDSEVQNLADSNITISGDSLLGVNAINMDGDLTFDGQVHPVFDPGSDIDVNLFEVSVTGAPIFKWDESESAFRQNVNHFVVGFGTFQSGVRSLVIGADSNLTTLTNATNKSGRIGMPHYTNAEQEMAIFAGSCTNIASTVQIGGGSSLLNAVTRIDIFAAADQITTTGTRIARFDLNTVSLGGTTGGSRLNVHGAIKIKEQAAADADVLTFGQLVLLNTTPQELWFVDETGTSTQIV